MSTGNLKRFVDSLFEGALHRDRTQLLRAGRYLSVIVTFSCGALLGAFACDRMGIAATLPAIAALGVVVATITVLRGRGGAALMTRHIP